MNRIGKSIYKLRYRVREGIQEVVFFAPVIIEAGAAKITQSLKALPRPHKDVSDRQLETMTLVTTTTTLVNIYQVVTGKSSSSGLIDRRLTKRGRTQAGIGLIVNTPFAIICALESWVRYVNAGSEDEAVNLDSVGIRDATDQ